VAVPQWIWLVFVFAFGCCVGSFLNVVIYRLPRDKSIVRPPSACPACGKHIAFYDNIPLISWLLLGRKCRACKAPISPRYFVVELLTGCLFLGLFLLYFDTDVIRCFPSFAKGGWLIWLVHVAMLAAFIAASAIDLELWVIPLSVCWLVTGVGLAGSAAAGYFVEPAVLRGCFLMPSTSDPFLAEATVASLAIGGAVGLGVAMVLLATGVVKRSYDFEQKGESSDAAVNHRREVGKEVVFLLPVLFCLVGAFLTVRYSDPVRKWLIEISQIPAVAGVLGSVWGYFVGCSVVWATRIFGTLAFGREAMGLGDVHLMGAAGAVIGPVGVVVGFFAAPFFGLAWALVQMLSKKTRQIPYGPFLSMGVLVAMIAHDRIFGYLALLAS